MNDNQETNKTTNINTESDPTTSDEKINKLRTGKKQPANKYTKPGWGPSGSVSKQPIQKDGEPVEYDVHNIPKNVDLKGKLKMPGGGRLTQKPPETTAKSTFSFKKLFS